MEDTLNPTQIHLLKLFAFNRGESFANEVKKVLTEHFQKQLEEETNRLWDIGVLSQDKLEKLRNADLHDNKTEHK